jgi:hypothetical protein
MDPEQVAIDAESVALARAERFGRGLLFRQQTERNIPRAYERPGAWPPNVSIEGLPSAQGFTGSGRTVHALRRQSQEGAGWNFPSFTALQGQGPGSVIMQALQQRPTPLRDRLTNLTRRF